MTKESSIVSLKVTSKINIVYLHDKLFVFVYVFWRERGRRFPFGSATSILKYKFYLTHTVHQYSVRTSLRTQSASIRQTC